MRVHHFAVLPLLLLAACDNPLSTRPASATMDVADRPASVVSGTIETIGTGVFPVVSQTHAAWQNPAGEIVLYDMAARSSTVIGKGIAPRISATRVVWFGVNPDHAGVPQQGYFAYDIASGSRRLIVGAPWQSGSGIDISGDQAAMLVSSGLRLENLATGQIRTVGLPAGVMYVRVSGDRAAYVAPHPFSANHIVMVRDFATGQTFAVGSNAPNLPPAIAGDRVAWSEFGSTGLDLRVRDLATDVAFTVAGDSRDNMFPSISGERVAWMNALIFTGIDQQSDARVFDFSTGESDVIAAGARAEAAPEIFGNNAVWMEADNISASEWEIRLMRVDAWGTPTLALLRQRLEQYVASGDVSNAGIADALRAQLEQAAAALDRGDGPSAMNKLAAFVRLLGAQSGKSVSSAAAGDLSALAEQISA